jgi:hypothetical protein
MQETPVRMRASVCEGPAAGLRRALFGLFLVLAGLEGAKWAFPASVPGDPRLLATLLFAQAAITLIVSLSCRLPLQNVLLASAIIALVGTAGDAAGQEVDVWPLRPLLWILAVLGSRGVAQALLRPWRQTAAYGYWQLAATAVLVVFCFAPLELLVSAASPAAPGFGLSAAVVHSLAPGVVARRAVTAVVALLLATPSLIDKRPAPN